MAQDGSGRPTDELLAVPSEVIDEETRRSLREEFALDGDETPDSWVEAALSARDDFSLDRLLTPLGLPAIVPSAEVSSAEVLKRGGVKRGGVKRGGVKTRRCYARRVTRGRAEC